MNLSRQQAAGLFFTLLIGAASLCFPRLGYSAVRNTGFEAGPLSISAEVVVEAKVKKPPVREIIPAGEEEDIGLKKADPANDPEAES